MSVFLNPFSLNRTVAAAAAAILRESFPGVELFEVSHTSSTFFCDFRCPFLLSAESENLIERKMRQMMHEQLPIRILEMVPSCAKALLFREGQPMRADQVQEDSLIQMVQIGSVHDIKAAGSYMPHLPSTISFKLHPVQHKGKNTYRLEGCAFFSKTELKDFLKLYRMYPKKSHIYFGEKESLWTLWDEQIVWLAEGLRKRREMIEMLVEHIFPKATEVQFISSQPRKILHRKFLSEIGVRQTILSEIYFEPFPLWDESFGFLPGVGGHQILVSDFSKDKNRQENLISSLQRIWKTLNILGFHPSLCLLGIKGGKNKKMQEIRCALDFLGEKVEVEDEEVCTPRLEFLIPDWMHRQWAAFSIELTDKAFFLTASVERLVALLLEKTFIELKNER